MYGVFVSPGDGERRVSTPVSRQGTAPAAAARPGAAQPGATFTAEGSHSHPLGHHFRSQICTWSPDTTRAWKLIWPWTYLCICVFVAMHTVKTEQCSPCNGSAVSVYMLPSKALRPCKCRLFTALHLVSAECPWLQLASQGSYFPQHAPGSISY
jgi:hypothetical protein